MSASKYSDVEIFRRLWVMARPFWTHLTGIFALELLSVPLALMLPIPVKIAVDSVVGNSPLPAYLKAVTPASWDDSKMALLWLAVFLQIFIVLLSNVQYLASYVLQTYAGERLKLRLRERLFSHVQRLSFSFHDTRGTSDSIFRIQYDAPAIQHIAIQGCIPLASSALKLLGMIYVIGLINIHLSLVALAAVPLLYMLASQYNKRMRPKYTHVQRLESSVLGIIQEVMTSFRVVKAFGREDSEQERFASRSQETIRTKINLSFAEGMFSIYVNCVTTVGTAAVLYIGVREVLSGTITLGELLIVMTYLAQLYAPLKSISQQVTNLQSSLASAHRALELLDEHPDVTEKPHARPLERAQGGVEYRHVSFAYNPDKRVLNRASFSIPPGARVGVKGRTGAGKTTLVSLMPRFYDPSEGAVLIDGVDVRDYNLRDLRRQFSIVLQDSILFSTSIYENILYAKPGAGREEVMAASRAANAHDFISRLSQGYETPVGEHGMKLSGGERQRIALARAFLKDAPILLLDEPTSAVDAKTEALIMEAMERLMKGRTTFMIAHRLSTLEHCDVLLEVADGTVAVLKNQALNH